MAQLHPLFALANIWDGPSAAASYRITTPEEWRDSEHAGTSPQIRNLLRPFLTASDGK
jgi:hypothetical protein